MGATSHLVSYGAETDMMDNTFLNKAMIDETDDYDEDSTTLIRYVFLLKSLTNYS